MAELHHECGIVAIYHLPNRGLSRFLPHLPDTERKPEHAASLVPRLLQDVQNRGQLAAGMSSFNPQRHQLIVTHKDVGSVEQVFRLGNRTEMESLRTQLFGTAAIGHVRYATCGKEDASYAQPFERSHIEKTKWFSFCFNGQLANYSDLQQQLQSQPEFHLARETDTEIIMHSICREFAGSKRPTFVQLLKELAQEFDGAYNIAYVNAIG
ncbi:MAG: class II glutamine amidotransferase, partial [Planctomycetes bacterium]|nr:class II glutamine amidotransferase [Planctomycetota bacterium]